MDWKGIGVHCSASRDTTHRNFDAIKAYHMSYRYNYTVVSKEEAERLMAAGEKVEKPWRDIGYNFVTEYIDGVLHTLIGRSKSISGAHISGYNHELLGYCIVGNFDDDTPSEEHYKEAGRVCGNQAHEHGFGVDMIVPHNKYANKTCPGVNVDMDRIRHFALERIKELNGQTIGGSSTSASVFSLLKWILGLFRRKK